MFYFILEENMCFAIIGCVFLFGTGILMYAMCCVSGKTNRAENDLEQEMYLHNLQLKEHTNGK